LPEADAGHPPATNLNGKPWIRGIGLPFILKAMRVSFCKALDMGNPLEIGSLSMPVEMMQFKNKIEKWIDCSNHINIENFLEFSPYLRELYYSVTYTKSFV